MNTYKLIRISAFALYISNWEHRIINFRQKGVIEIVSVNKLWTKEKENEMKTHNSHVKQIAVYSCSLDCNEIETIYDCVVCTVMYNENNERIREMTIFCVVYRVYSLEWNRRHVWVWKKGERGRARARKKEKRSKK